MITTPLFIFLQYSKEFLHFIMNNTLTSIYLRTTGTVTLAPTAYIIKFTNFVIRDFTNKYWNHLQVITHYIDYISIQKWVPMI